MERETCGRRRGKTERERSEGKQEDDGAEAVEEAEAGRKELFDSRRGGGKLKARKRGEKMLSGTMEKRREAKRSEEKSREERREGEAERSSSRGRGDKKLVKGVFFCVFLIRRRLGRIEAQIHTRRAAVVGRYRSFFCRSAVIIALCCFAALPTKAGKMESEGTRKDRFILLALFFAGSVSLNRRKKE